MTTKEYNICVETHADAVFRFILKNIRDEEAAKDIVQDTFEKIWIRHKEINFEKSKSYLFTAAYRTLIDYTRKRKYIMPEEAGNAKELYHENQYSDVKEIVEAALNTLPETQKAVITLRDLEGYSYEEIGEITGLNESQVKVYIYRGRLAIKEYITKLDIVL